MDARWWVLVQGRSWCSYTWINWFLLFGKDLRKQKTGNRIQKLQNIANEILTPEFRILFLSSLIKGKRVVTRSG